MSSNKLIELLEGLIERAFRATYKQVTLGLIGVAVNGVVLRGSRQGGWDDVVGGTRGGGVVVVVDWLRVVEYPS